MAERNRTEYETELNLQKIDNVLAAEQIEALKKFDEEFVSCLEANSFLSKYTQIVLTMDKILDFWSWNFMFSYFYFTTYSSVSC